MIKFAIPAVIKGQGDYRSDIKTGLTTLGSGLGGKLASLFGFGDYTVRVNSLVYPGKDDQVPMFGNDNGAVRIRHREYITDIFGSVLFDLTSYQINPAAAATFPWLSKIAINFEQWCPHGIVFDYRSMSSEMQVAATTALGTVILGTEYNALATRFVNKQSMEASQFAVSVKPSVSVMHPIECDITQTPSQPLYVRLPGDASVNADPRLYDLGNFQVATQGMAINGGDQGELWVTYDIELLKPILNSPPATLLDLSSHFTVTNYFFGTPAPDAIYDLTRAGPVTPINALGVTYTPGAYGGFDLVFPPHLGTGPYLVTLGVTCDVYQTVALGGAPPLGTTGSSNVNFPNLFRNDTTYLEWSPSKDTPGVTGTDQVLFSLIFKIDDVAAEARLPLFFYINGDGFPTVPITTATSVSTYDLIITRLSEAFA
jgi:hypothetical protein